MESSQQELIWRGRLHLGDGPGTYGDAAYAGLRVDLPVTVTPFGEDHGGSGPDQIWFTVRGDDVRIQRGQEGHPVAVVLRTQGPGGGSWVEEQVGSGVLRGKTEEVLVDGGDLRNRSPGPYYLSVRVSADTSAAPGLYDDFVLVSVEMRSGRYYASLGFTR